MYCRPQWPPTLSWILRLRRLTRGKWLNRDLSIPLGDEEGKSAELRADHAQLDLIGPDGSRARARCIVGGLAFPGLEASTWR